MPPVRYDVRDVATGADGAIVAHVEVSGDFAGSPVALAFRFGFDEAGLIETLTIRA